MIVSRLTVFAMFLPPIIHQVSSYCEMGKTMESGLNGRRNGELRVHRTVAESASSVRRTRCSPSPPCPHTPLGSLTRTHVLPRSRATSLTLALVPAPAPQCRSGP